MTLDVLQRPDRLWCHTLETPQSAGSCLFHEKDDRFWCCLSRSLSGDFVIFLTTSKRSSEVWVIPFTDCAVAVSCEGGAKQVVAIAGASIGMLREKVVGVEQKVLEEPPALPYMLVIHPCSEDVLYSSDHYVPQATGSPEDQPSGKQQRVPEPLNVFVILTNRDGATNFKMCVARVPQQHASPRGHRNCWQLLEVDWPGGGSPARVASSCGCAQMLRLRVSLHLWVSQRQRQVSSGSQLAMLSFSLNRARISSTMLTRFNSSIQVQRVRP